MANINPTNHFSFTRNRYDNCATDKSLKQSTDPFNIITQQGIKEHETNCNLDNSPFMHENFYNIPAKFVEVEDELFCKTQKLSKCPDGPKTMKTEFLPQCTKQIQNNMSSVYSRIDKPASVYDTIITNHFPPLDDIQHLNMIHSNNYIGVNTRLQVKDAYTKNKIKK